MDQTKLVKRFVIATFVTLYALVSIISTIHVIDFFELSNPYWLAVSLAIGFEVGAAASLASLVILDKMNKTLVWALFITITLMQMQGNMYYAFTNLSDFQSWSELFNIIEEDLIDQKRILAAVSGAILPLVALGFIKSLVDYIKPEEDGGFTPEDSSFSNITDEDSGNMFVDLEDLDEKIDRDFDLDEEEWDEDHAMDQVLNDMVEDFSEEELEEVFGDSVESEEDLDLLEEAKRKLAEEKLNNFVQNKRNDGANSSKA